MPYPSGTYINQIADPAVRAELEQDYSLLQGYLSVEHKDDGTHGDVTADSLTATANSAAGTTGNISADGTVTADADGTPVALGPDVIFGPGVRLTNGTLSDWRVEATQSGGLPTLSIRDVLRLASGDTGTVDLIRLTSGALSTYILQPHASYIALQLGQDASGQRLSAAYVSGVVQAGTLLLRSRLVPTTLSANTNDYAINTAARVFLSSTGAVDITGIAAGADGQLLWVINAASGGAITLKNNSASSAVGNRILAANGADVTLRVNNGSALLQYDSTAGFWYVLGA